MGLSSNVGTRWIDFFCRSSFSLHGALLSAVLYGDSQRVWVYLQFFPNIPAIAILCRLWRLLQDCCRVWARSPNMISLTPHPPHLNRPPCCVPRSNCLAGWSPIKSFSLSCITTQVLDVIVWGSSFRQSIRAWMIAIWCSMLLQWCEVSASLLVTELTVIDRVLARTLTGCRK